MSQMRALVVRASLVFVALGALACAGGGGSTDAALFCEESYAARCQRDLRAGRTDEQGRDACLALIPLLGCAAQTWPAGCAPPYTAIDRCLDALEDPAADGELVVAACDLDVLCP